jgi:SP family general alpha glucoside:H+ symporter-like MFS transporter
MADSKAESKHVPHPSEALEFATTALQPHMEHIEFITRPSQLDDDSRLGGSTRRLTLSKSQMDGVDAGIKAERRLTIRNGLPLYAKAIGWSILLSLTIVMEGYDLTIINSFYAFPEFKQAYGVSESNNTLSNNDLSNTDYQITTAWQSALTNGAIVGEIFGLLFNGHLTEKFGYRYTLMGALVALCTFIFLAFFAFNIGLLMASEVLCGLSWGVFQTLSTTYAAEIMPVALRAYLTSNVNLCWLIGQIVGTGVLRGLINLQSQWSYRIPFALQWMWAVPILVGVLFAPESPWWLVRHGKPERAKKALQRLTRKGVDFNVDETVQLMKRTNEIEESMGAGTSYLDCFRGVNLRRTEIACMVWMTQTLCGSPLTGYATYFYVQAGFATEPAFDLSLGMYGMAILGGMISWFLLPVVGRRTLYLWGTGLIFFILIIAGSVGTQPATSSWVQWTLGSLVILLTFVYDTTIGPVCYSLVAEIPSTRLRVKTVVLARVAYNIVGLISNVLMPKMLNPTAWNWRGKTCYLWAGTCLLCYIWCYYRLPEPKGLTYLELDLLFEKKVTARKFGKVQNILFESGYFQIPGPDESKGLNDWRGYTT